MLPIITKLYRFLSGVKEDMLRALGRYRVTIGRVLNYYHYQSRRDHGDHANTHLITGGGLASSPWSGE